VGGSNIGSQLCASFVLFVFRGIRIYPSPTLRDRLISLGGGGVDYDEFSSILLEVTKFHHTKREVQRVHEDIK